MIAHILLHLFLTIVFQPLFLLSDTGSHNLLIHNDRAPQQVTFSQGHDTPSVMCDSSSKDVPYFTESEVQTLQEYAFHLATYRDLEGGLRHNSFSIKQTQNIPVIIASNPKKSVPNKNRLTLPDHGPNKQMHQQLGEPYKPSSNFHFNVRLHKKPACEESQEKLYMGLPLYFRKGPRHTFSYYTEDHFRAHFNECYSHLNKVDFTGCIIHQFAFHQFPEFRKFIKTLPHYKCHIIRLLEIIQKEPELKKQLKWVQGFGKKNDFIKYVEAEVASIHEQDAQILKEKKRREEHAQGLIDSVALLENRTLCSEYQQIIFNDYASEIDQQNDPTYERLLKRKNALEETIKNGGQKTRKNYSVPQNIITHGNPDARSFCQEIWGTAYQHTLQDEFIQLYDQALDFEDGIAQENHHSVIFLNECIEAGLEFNQGHHDTKATLLADLCWGLLEALPQAGMSLALYSLPGMSTVAAVQLALSTATVLVPVLYNVGELCYAKITDQASYYNNVIERMSKGCEGVQTMISDRMKKSSRKDNVRDSAAFALEWALTGKVNRATSAWYKKIQTKISSTAAGKAIKNTAESIVEHLGLDALSALWARDMLHEHHAASNAPTNPKGSTPIKSSSGGTKSSTQSPTGSGHAPANKASSKSPIVKAAAAQIPVATPLLDAAGKQLTSPCGRPLIKLGPYVFVDLFKHEYDQILSFFKNHPVSISVEKIRHIIFGEIKKNGMHTGGHFDFGAYALRNNGNLLNYVKTKVGGILEVEMLLASGKPIKKHYFPHDSCVVEFFREIAAYLEKPSVLNNLTSIPPEGRKFKIHYNNIDVRFIVTPNCKIKSAYPII